MDPLRLVIFLIGLAVIAGVYLRYREPSQSSDDAPSVDKPSMLEKLKALWPAKSAEQEGDEHRLGPQISLEDVDSLGTIKVHSSEVTADELADSVHIEWDSMTPVAAKDECIIVLNILARPGEYFAADNIQNAAAQAGFKLGDRQVFHYYSDKLSDQAPPVCSFANAVEPGHFAAIASADFTSPGISLFARLPGPLDARETFRLMLDKAHGLASSLGGVLCDESRSILSDQTIGHLKEKVEAFRFKQQMAAMKQRRH